jgi:hypothetical protein
MTAWRRSWLSAVISALAVADPALPIVLDLAIPEFVALQRLSDSERRSRFHLPDSCEPTIAASRARRTRVVVIIGCADPDGDDADVSSPRAVTPDPTGPPRARPTPP